MAACATAHSNDIVAEGEVPVRLAESYSFTEGPATDARGNVYFTDQPNNRIYRWDCESGEITLFTDQSGRSNGMYFDAQGNLIACADMDNQLWSFNMKGQHNILVTDYRGKLLNGPNDVLKNRQVFADMGSDGMTIDDRGNIYLTGDGVTVFDKDGQQIAHFPIPEDWTANVCFGGKERNILFITASKSVYTLKMLVHGVK